MGPVQRVVLAPPHAHRDEDALLQERLPETPELADKLKISKNDLRMLKLYNMLVVV